MNKRLRRLLGYSFAVFFSFCCVCMVISFALYNSGSILSTPTPAVVLPQLDISTIIVQTSSAAQTQTQTSYNTTPQSLATGTFTPTVTMIPNNNVATATIFIFQLQTNVAQPTELIYSTNTPISLATDIIQPTQPPSSGNCNPSYPDVCINGNPRLNCTQLKAKGIKHFKVLAPDPLGYDRDGDGIGCE